MTEEIPIQKSPVEQIFDEMFAIIEGQEKFDTELIQKLKDLAVKGDLKKAQQIYRVITSAPEGIP
jgi:hypothetical protein